MTEVTGIIKANMALQELKKGKAMTNYEKERDEAAEKFAPGEYIAMADFKAGADWANARAEKRAQVLVDAIKGFKQDIEMILRFRSEESIAHAESGLNDLNEVLAQFKGESDE